jgi:hypothetical protein
MGIPLLVTSSFASFSWLRLNPKASVELPKQSHLLGYREAKKSLLITGALT